MKRVLDRLDAYRRSGEHERRRLRLYRRRNKQMIIRGGKNIYSRELEEFFLIHPAMADVQVIGIPC